MEDSVVMSAKYSNMWVENCVAQTYLRCVRVESPVVYVYREVDGAGETDILCRRANSSIGEEEGHRYQCTENHSVSPPEILPIAQKSSCDRSKNSNRVGDHIVPPRIVRAVLTRLGTTAGEEFGQEYVEKRVGESNQRPREPDQRGRDTHLLGCKKATEMGNKLGEPISRLSVR